MGTASLAGEERVSEYGNLWGTLYRGNDELRVSDLDIVVEKVIL